MINATRQSDWEAVLLLSQQLPAMASLGLHPWWQKERSNLWQNQLDSLLRSNPNCAIGETGLDRWMPNPDLQDQIAVLEQHLELAQSHKRPVTIHCLKAWPELKGVLKRAGTLPRSYLLHSYSGPPELTDFWIESGAYFSFSPAFLAPSKTARRNTFRSLPLNRILIETDAPDMAPPRDLAIANLASGLNHPANLRLCLEALATDFEMTSEVLAKQLLENSLRLFGNPAQTATHTAPHA